MNHHQMHFANQRIDLHGNTYHGCRFEHCELVFDGDRSPTFHDNEFLDCTFVFTGAAVRTLYFLCNIYHAGEGGREVIEHTLRELREHRLHGHEIRTPVPPTADHSLH